MSGTCIKAVSIALAVFCVMYLGLRILLRLRPMWTGEDNYNLFVNVAMVFVWISPGYIAAMVLRRNGPLVGAITGLLAGCIVLACLTVINHGFVFKTDWYGWIWSGFISGLVGGSVWFVQAQLVRWARRSNI